MREFTINSVCTTDGQMGSNFSSKLAEYISF